MELYKNCFRDNESVLREDQMQSISCKDPVIQLLQNRKYRVRRIQSLKDRVIIHRGVFPTLIRSLRSSLLPNVQGIFVRLQ